MIVVNFIIIVRFLISLSYEVKGIDVRVCGYFILNFVLLWFIFKNVDLFGEDVYVMFKIGDDMR